MKVGKAKKYAKEIYLALNSKQYKTRQKGAKATKKVYKYAKKGKKGPRLILAFLRAYFRDGPLT